MKKLATVIFCFFVFLPMVVAEEINGHEEIIETHTKICPRYSEHEITIVNLYEDYDDRFSNIFIGEPNSKKTVIITWPYGAGVDVICGGKWTKITFLEPTWAVVD